VRNFVVESYLFRTRIGVVTHTQLLLLLLLLPVAAADNLQQQSKWAYVPCSVLRLLQLAWAVGSGAAPPRHFSSHLHTGAVASPPWLLPQVG
jgi:hypothetical protein